jgi:hypothetical protein
MSRKPKKKISPALRRRAERALAKLKAMDKRGPIVLDGMPELPGRRKYLPTISDLVDRLSIVQLKAIFIGEHRDEYLDERKLIEHDIDLILAERQGAGERVTASDIHAIIIIMLTNRFIWENESKARSGENGQDALLKLTHSINGVRNAAKNQLARLDGGRRDFKIDCFAAELVKDFGNWNVF